MVFLLTSLIFSRCLKALQIKLSSEWRRNFLWANKKLYFPNWARICSPNKDGGLGLARLDIINVALLRKWWWKWYSNRGKQWSEVIKDKNNLVPQDDLLKCLTITHQSEIIKGICSLNPKPHLSNLFAKEQFQWNLGKGNSILFWEDIWNGSNSLDSRFSRLYRFSNLKFKSIKDIKNLRTNVFLKIKSWSRELRGWEWDLVQAAEHTR